MKATFLAITVFLGSLLALAKPALIHALDAEYEQVNIALDSTNSPHVNGDPNTYPTIKNFREGSDYYKVCYMGSDKEVRSLLDALVTAAKGDGDSY